MTPSIQRFVADLRNTYKFAPGKVLEVGSQDVNGSIRPHFQDAESYLGIDMAPGNGVDVVLCSHAIPKIWEDGYFDTVISCECLEHDLKPWQTVKALHNVLRRNGHMLITTPTFGFGLHRYPRDYFRFGEDAYREWIFAGFKVIKYQQEEDNIICCFGQKV